MASQKSLSTAKIGLFTGSFDPVTYGHLDVIIRASQLFDKLYVAVFENHEKQALFSLDERLSMLQENLQKFSNVELIKHQRDLTVNIARELKVTALIRSIRNSQDFDYESNMIYFNHEMTGVETILLVARPELGMISSSRVKELSSYGQDVSKYVPENVAQKLQERFK